MDFLEIYNTIKEQLVSYDSSYSFSTLDSNTIQVLTENVCKNPYLLPDNAWESFNKICNLTGGHIYIDYENKISLHCDFGD